MPLPAGVSQQDFDAAMSGFRAVVGEEWVFTNESDINTYRDGYGPLYGTSEEPYPSGAVAPENVEQVRSLVRIASEYGIPFWINSTGRNFGYGGPAGVAPGNVNLDLRRMNRILEVNEKHGYAVVEPGVGFFDLFKYIRERGLKLWMDVPGPGWGSVLANTLEHGMGYTNYSERIKFTSGLEVVLPDGDLIRTGMGAIPDSELWQQFPMGLGPYVDGIFTQTSLGVVTKLGLWLQPEPEVFLSADIVHDDFDSLVPMLDLLQPLRQAGLVPNNATPWPQRRSAGSTTNSSTTDSEARDPRDDISWSLQLSWYGIADQVDAMWEHTRAIYERELPGARIEVRRYTPPLAPGELDPIAAGALDPRDSSRAGVPTLNITGHPAFFSTVVPFEGAAAMRLIDLYDDIAKQYGRRYSGAPYHSDSPRSLITTPGGSIRFGDDEHNQITMQIMREWITETTRIGWGAYRVHTALMAEAMDGYHFNDNAILRFNNRLKDALDPSGILAPGKNGIWPRHLRENEEGQA